MEIANLEWKIFSRHFDEVVVGKPYWVLDSHENILVAVYDSTGSWIWVGFYYSNEWTYDTNDDIENSVIAFADFDIDMLPISRPVKISITTEEE